MSKHMECHKCGGLVPTVAIREHIQICRLFSADYSQFTNVVTTLNLMRDEIAKVQNINSGIITSAKRQEQNFLRGQSPSIKTGRHIIGHWTAPGLENPEQETQNQPKKFSPRRIGEWVNNRLKRND